MERFVIFFMSLLLIVSCKEKEAESTITFTYTGDIESKTIKVWPFMDIYPVKIYWGIGDAHNMNRILNQRILSSSISLSEDGIGKDYTATLTGMVVGLECRAMRIKSIDISNCHTLTRLDCSMNSLISLDLSRNRLLSELSCGMNDLSSLDLSNIPGLSILDCSANPIIHLDVSNNIALEVLNCRDTKLSRLDVSQCKMLKQLNCMNSPLSSEALNDLFRTLPKVINGKVRITGTTGENDCDKSIATAKGWRFQN